ncbi:MAG TPA: APC family permease [Polyangia bacterium]
MVEHEPEGAPAEPPAPESEPPSALQRLLRVLLGAPRSLADTSIFHRLTLIAFLAWVGLGADGLSSSAYGPDEAFRTVGEHRYLLVALAAMTAITIFVIAAAYSRIIEEFPHGGGGYNVATLLLGPRAGLVAGAALIVDYVLTIAVSIAGAGDALFSLGFLQPYASLKLPFEIAAILALTIINIRGVRESILTLMPIFVLFLVTHALAIVGGFVVKVPEVPVHARAVAEGFHAAAANPQIGTIGILLLFMKAYSMGGGTYTGLEAVSNSLQLMREPRVQTAKRTMAYMAVSLAITAGGLLLCYLLWNVAAVPGKTMNAVLVERMMQTLPGGSVFVFFTLLAEALLLVVAGQAGLIAGPRVLANMAVDSWVPRGFAALSERLTTQNGIVLMGAASLAILLYEGGDLRRLVVMYSINVFLTFSLSMFGMARHTWRTRRQRAHYRRRTGLFVFGFLLCGAVLVITTLEKFTQGGWLTVTVTSSLIFLCFLIRRHYRLVGSKLQALFAELGAIPEVPGVVPAKLDPARPTAALLVGGFGGLGIHTMLNIFRAFPGHFKNLVVVGVGVLGSGEFKGEGAVEDLRRETAETLRKYVALAQKLGVPATYRLAVGTDAVSEATRLCLEVAKEFPNVTFFAGKIIFQRDRWYQRFLHNETAFAIEKRLQWAGKTMAILPARVR